MEFLSEQEQKRVIGIVVKQLKKSDLSGLLQAQREGRVETYVQPYIKAYLERAQRKRPVSMHRAASARYVGSRSKSADSLTLTKSNLSALNRDLTIDSSISVKADFTKPLAHTSTLELYRCLRSTVQYLPHTPGDSLNIHCAYLIYNGLEKQLYVWIGRNCDPIDMDMASNLAPDFFRRKGKTIKPPVTITDCHTTTMDTMDINEKMLWWLMAGTQEVFSGTVAAVVDTALPDPNQAVEIYEFSREPEPCLNLMSKFSVDSSGRCYKMPPSVLSDRGIFVVECAHIVYMWIGRSPTAELMTHQAATTAKVTYSRTSKSIRQIRQGREPMAFKVLFDDWDGPKLRGFNDNTTISSLTSPTASHKVLDTPSSSFMSKLSPGKERTLDDLAADVSSPSRSLRKRPGGLRHSASARYISDRAPSMLTRVNSKTNLALTLSEANINALNEEQKPASAHSHETVAISETTPTSVRSPLKLFRCYKGSVQFTPHSYGDKLNVYCAYLIFSPKERQLYVWIGRFVASDDKSLAAAIAPEYSKKHLKCSSPPVVVRDNDNEESLDAGGKFLWRILTGKKSQHLMPKLDTSVPPSNQSVQVFSFTRDPLPGLQLLGTYDVNDTGRCAKIPRSVLVDTEVIIIQCPGVVYVWLGRSLRLPCMVRESVTTARAVYRTGNRTVQQVRSRRESSVFRSLFEGWVDAAAVSRDDEYVAPFVPSKTISKTTTTSSISPRRRPLKHAVSERNIGIKKNLEADTKEPPVGKRRSALTRRNIDALNRQWNGSESSKTESTSIVVPSAPVGSILKDVPFYRCYKRSVQFFPHRVGDPLNSHCAYLIYHILAHQLYVWIGSDCEVEDYHLAKSTANEMSVIDLKSFKRPVFIKEDDSKGALDGNEKFLWHLLNGDYRLSATGETERNVSSDVPAPNESVQVLSFDPNIPQKFLVVSKYNVDASGRCYRMAPSVLSDKGVFIIECAHVVYMWVGYTTEADCMLDEAATAVNDKYKNSGKLCQLVLQSNESTAFKALFDKWDLKLVQSPKTHVLRSASIATPYATDISITQSKQQSSRSLNGSGQTEKSDSRRNGIVRSESHTNGSISNKESTAQSASTADSSSNVLHTQDTSSSELKNIGITSSPPTWANATQQKGLVADRRAMFSRQMSSPVIGVSIPVHRKDKMKAESVAVNPGKLIQTPESIDRQSGTSTVENIAFGPRTSGASLLGRSLPTPVKEVDSESTSGDEQEPAAENRTPLSPKGIVAERRAVFSHNLSAVAPSSSTPLRGTSLSSTTTDAFRQTCNNSTVGSIKPLNSEAAASLSAFQGRSLVAERRAAYAKTKSVPDFSPADGKSRKIVP